MNLLQKDANSFEFELNFALSLLGAVESALMPGDAMN